MLPVDQLPFCPNSIAPSGLAGFVRGHDVWLLAILCPTILVPARDFGLRISRPLNQHVHHESAPHQTKRREDNHCHGTNPDETSAQEKLPQRPRHYRNSPQEVLSGS